jgi:hypothetical protein
MKWKVCSRSEINHEGSTTLSQINVEKMSFSALLPLCGECTLIKIKSNFPHILYKEVQNGAVVKSYMRMGFLMRKCANIQPYIRRPLVIYDFATAPFLNFLIDQEIFFLFYQCMHEGISTVSRGTPFIQKGSGQKP